LDGVIVTGDAAAGAPCATEMGEVTSDGSVDEVTDESDSLPFPVVTWSVR